MRLYLTAVFVVSVYLLPQFSVADEASVEASRKAYNTQMIKQWEWNKDALKDDYKQTKSYKKKSSEEQKKFDKDWSKRRNELGNSISQ